MSNCLERKTVIRGSQLEGDVTVENELGGLDETNLLLEVVQFGVVCYTALHCNVLRKQCGTIRCIIMQCTATMNYVLVDANLCRCYTLTQCIADHCSTVHFSFSSIELNELMLYRNTMLHRDDSG